MTIVHAARSRLLTLSAPCRDQFRVTMVSRAPQAEYVMYVMKVIQPPYVKPSMLNTFSCSVENPRALMIDLQPSKAPRAV